MKKLSFLAVAFTAIVFASCGGNKTNPSDADAQDSLKSFEQQQIEANIKVQFDSLAAELGKLKQTPIVNKDGTLVLSDEEKQVKPDYLLDPAVAENTTTLAEKYRMLSALQVDKHIAELYDMPVEAYDKAITKLAADINDPSFKAINEDENIYETSQTLYDAMSENGRINYFWQLVSTALVEQLYITSQNTDKFITAFDDDAAANVTFRIILIQDAIERLAAYDCELDAVATAIEPLTVLNATTVDELKTQLEEAKDKIVASRNALLK